MSRPLRPQACGAIYHVTSRGVRRMPIFVDAFDYSVWLDVLAEAAARYTLVIHAYCQMPNHYHLVVETPLGNIAAGIRYLNGKYCQYFNRKHKHLGHVSQCRYNAEMIERQAYLLELARYVVLNPVRAQLVSAAASWKWSSHQALLGYVPLPAWLDGDWILSQFGNGTRERHVEAYTEFVEQGIGLPDPLRHRRKGAKPSAPAVPSQATATPPIDAFFARFSSPDEAALRAYLSSAYSIRAIAQHLRISPRSLMRLLRRLGKLL
ncbi:transposase [Pseudoduganella aquatica]|nr:transposase [Pseudoduganella aquatica]